MDEDEAALLAELRAISNGSAAASRFGQDDHESTEDAAARDQSNDASFVSAKSSSSTDFFPDVPPDSMKKENPSLSASPVAPEDEKMNQVDVSCEEEPEKAIPPSTSMEETTQEDNEATQKEESNNQIEAAEEKVDIVVAAPFTPTEESAPQGAFPEKSVPETFGIKDSKPSTFTGDRGGSAEDAELLAELRAISAKSSSASRFADESDGAEASTTESAKSETANEEMPLPAKEAIASDTAKLPPWKRGKTKAVAETSPMEVDIVVAAPPAPPSSIPVEEQAFGIKDSKPSTVTGDRGGAAEDAELLAELRAISAKSSSADRFADETSGNGAETSTTESANSETAKEKSAPLPAKEAKESDTAKLPPWKRGKTKAVTETSNVDMDVDIVVAAPPAPPSSIPVEEQAFGIKDSKPSTVTGDRGGAAEDAELLAELRAISAKSSSADRFADETSGNGAETSTTESANSETAKEKSAPLPAKEAKEPDTAKLPPWKRGETKAVAEASPKEVGVVVAAPPPIPVEEQAFGIKDSKPSTFTGDRGGAAEDAELLAELRAISAKSSSSSRFAEESNDNVGEANKTVLAKDVVAPTREKQADENVSDASKSKPVAAELPPWKRGKNKVTKSPSDEVDIFVAAPPVPTPDSVSIQARESSKAQEQSFGIKSALPSTFQGDRGGSAEDAELLAELRAISQKSSNADRFSDDIGADGEHANTKIPVSHTGAIAKKKVAAESVSRQESSSKANSKSPADVPPWKRANKKATESPVPDVDVVIAASPAPPSPPDSVQTDTSVKEPVPETFGIKPALPSTFKGDRGGVAEDEELLAELRAISAKSTGTARFAEESSGGDIAIPEPAVNASISDGSKPSRPPPSSKVSSSKVGEAQLPPWKRGKKKATETPDVDVVVAAPEAPVVQQKAGIQSSLPSTFQGERGGPAEDAELLAELRAVSSQPRGGIKSDLPSTFKGERGGSAEDADLLAELRAISSNSSSGNRLADDSADPTSISKETAGQSVAKKSVSAPSRDAPVVPTMASQNTAPPSNAASGGGEVTVTRESLPAAVTDKSWKLRKEAYNLLHSILSEHIEKGEGQGTIDGNTLLPGLDDLIASMVSDSNAGALDSALAFAVVYAEHGSGASSSELASKIVASLIKGSALSSSRPSTSKSATALTLKLMEVGDGYASVHSVTEVLLSQGLSSRKPKVVIASSNVILQAAYGFGAGSLPLASISSSAPKMLSHTNATVRDTGLKIIAETCRALGSKSPLQSLIEGMKKAQQSQLDSLLESQTEPTPISIGLRSSKGSSSQPPADALAALETGAKELEAKRYAEREPVNIFQALLKTDYSTRIKLPKWSEKVAALDLVLECGGEKPYKLVHPSPSANYSPLISEMKTLLSHSHFAVASKAMKILSMLAEGVGSGLFSHLRPLLRQLIMLSKDKKLNRAVGECLDVYFGNVLDIEHLLDTDDALPSVLNEKVQKNALVRASSLVFLGRCVKRGESAGPRGRISGKSSAAVARLCCDKLDDSDASVRKSATETLSVLLSVEDEAISDSILPIIESLQTKNSRAYKSLMKGRGGNAQRKGGVSKAASGPSARAASSDTRRTQTSPPNRKPPSQEVQKTSRQRTASQPVSKERSAVGARPTLSSNRAAISSGEVRIEDSSDAPSVEDAISLVASMSVPSWDAPDDDGGVLAGLKSSKWLLRQNAILNLATFSKEEESPVNGTEGPSAAVISVVKGHTKNFKETNVNVTKAIMELFIALSQIHAEQGRPFPGWASRDAVSLAVEKIADKKLSAFSSKLMSELCCVRPPQSILEHGIACIDKVKSPLGHEAFLKWFQIFLSEFGAPPISVGLKGASPWLVKECESSNPKVRRVAMSVAGELHVQLGPIFRAVILSSCGDTASIKSQLERTFDESPFDPDAAKMERSRECVVLQSNVSAGSGGETTASSVLLDLPKMDLPASLPSDCIEKMGTKEGKNAWKMRKQALDDVEDALKRNNGLMISTDSLKPLVDLLRALRERLSDSQSNLKPVAARIIGTILGSVNSASQAKLGRIAFAPLVGAVCNDNRKPMREASLEAIRVGTTASSVEGGEPNSSALESLMVAVVGELGESEFKAGGLPDMLTFVTGVAEFLPNLDSVASARAQTLGDKFAAVMVGCLTSSKSETRSTAETLLRACIERDKLSLESVKKGMKKLLPAQQRTVIPIVARLPHTQPGSPNDGKENSVPSPPRGSRQRKPAGVSSSRTTVSSPRQRRRPATSERVEATSKRPVPPSQADDSLDVEPSDPDDSHPLIANGEPGKKPLSSSRRINWPLHPEEPTSPVQINALKRMWSRSLPTRSAHALFPSGGIKKQEDAMAGCALLCKAIEKDRAGNEEAIVDHIDLIFMWTSFALCSRESTVGLQSLITLLIRLFAFLDDHRYKLSDNDASILLPHIFEKASIAKGRFREQFNNVISVFRSDIMSTRSLGQVICVPLIEHSHQSKTRVLAMHECRSCVDLIGLSGLGKKGLLVTAKTLSEENLPENRTAALELMETVLAKMDGDVEKLASICGPNYLSDKGRAMIEEHWSKHGGNRQSTKPKSLQRDSNARRQSQIPSSRASSAINRSRRTIPKSSLGFDANHSPDRSAAARTATEGMIRDELPSFKLELDETKSAGIDTRHTDSSLPSSGPFTFSFSNMRALHDTGSEAADIQEEVTRQEPDSSVTHQANTRPVASSVAASSDTGAAASLRARLLKIREKQKEEAAPSHSAVSTSAPQPELSPTVLAESPLTDPSSSVRVPMEKTAKAEIESSHGASENSYDALHTCIEELLHTERPVPEAHPRLRDCTAALKKYHATISSQPAAAPDMSYGEFSDLRQSILDKTVEVIENLTSVVVFALDCEYPENTAGMSIPLLSVALATLMALFRDTNLTQNVTQDSLALLIREAGKALLDPRLAMSSHHAMVSQLDESTSSQMVRAINKLAVQAATGSPRDVSIEALLALQLQLCTVGNESAADAAFNSRLSRIVTKLFAKVLKAESASARPFSSETIDLEAIICALEDMLLATALAPGAPNRNRQDAVDTCSNMGRSLLIPLLNARGQGGMEELRAMMEELGIDPRESKLALLVSSCESELDFSAAAAAASTAVEEDVKQVPSPADAPSPSRPPSMNIASLVSDLTSAPEGPQRDAAVAALRRYNELHGKEELHDHLSEVSETFRAYIMEQLNESTSPEKASYNENTTTDATQNTSMSERIRFLRSKLSATEAVVQSAVEQQPMMESVKPTVDTQESALSKPTTSQPTTPSRRGIPAPSTPSRRGTTKEARLTPSRIPKPGAASSPSKTTRTAQTLRERLAAAQKNRKEAAAAAAAAENEVDGGKSGSSTSAYGHAAALRARLEAVKQQTQSERQIK